MDNVKNKLRKEQKEG